MWWFVYKVCVCTTVLVFCLQGVIVCVWKKASALTSGCGPWWGRKPWCCCWPWRSTWLCSCVWRWCCSLPRTPAAGAPRQHYHSYMPGRDEALLLHHRHCSTMTITLLMPAEQKGLLPGNHDCYWATSTVTGQPRTMSFPFYCGFKVGWAAVLWACVKPSLTLFGKRVIQIQFDTTTVTASGLPGLLGLLTFMRAVSPPSVWAFTKDPASSKMATVVRKFWKQDDNKS